MACVIYLELEQPSDRDNKKNIQHQQPRPPVNEYADYF